MSYLGRSAKLSLKAQEKVSFLATAGQTVKTGLSYVPNFIEVYVNGILLTDTTDFTATNGNSVTFTVALALNDEVTVISLKTFSVADHYTKSEDDALLAAKLPLAGGTMTGDTAHGDNVKAKFGTGNDLNIYHDGSDSYIEDAGTGSLWVASNEFRVANAAVSENMIIATENAAVKLYHDNALKLETTATGIAVTGGVAIGGTGAANTLDDYEEGTWTPAILYGSLTITAIESAHYTKIGNVVTLQTYLTLANDGNTTDMQITGLPFVNGGTGSAANQYYMGVVSHGGGSNQTEIKYCRAQSNASYITIYKKAALNVSQDEVEGNYFLISITYRTTA